MAFQCGPIRYEITSATAIDSMLLQRELIVHETVTTLADEERRDTRGLPGPRRGSATHRGDRR